MTAKATFLSPYAETASVTKQAYSFLTDNDLYYMLGYGSVLSSGIDPTKVWADEEDPPAPDNHLEYTREAWDELLLGLLIDPSRVHMAIPSRHGPGDTGFSIIKPWAERTDDSERTFTAWSATQDYHNDIVGFQKNQFFAKEVTVNATPTYEIWLLLDTGSGTDVVGSDANNIPDSSTMTTDNSYLNDGTDTISTTAGGAIWKYLYTVHPDSSLIEIAGPIEENYWIPVNAGPTAIDEAEGTTLGVEPDVPNLHSILGVRNVLMEIRVPASFTEIEFRQNWIVVNPEIDSQPGGAEFGPSNFVTYSGNVLYIENRPPQVKQQDQQETVLIAFNY